MAVILTSPYYKMDFNIKIQITKIYNTVNINKDAFILTLILSTIWLLIGAFILQKLYFDFNVFLVLIIYTLPVVFISWTNGLLINLIENIKVGPIRSILILALPVVLLTFMSLFSNGPFQLIGIFTLFPVLITNVIWINKT